MKLTVILGTSQEVSFDIQLYDNSFVQKWVKELSWCLDNCEFNQREAFTSLITLDESSTILTNACHTINKYVKNFIEVKEDIQFQPQEYFNYLHSKFEKLSGKFGKPTRLFSIANDELKSAIRDLNSFIHRVEKKKSPKPNLYISFNKDTYRRYPFNNGDYEFFEFSHPAGTLFLHYMELGKEFVDLYDDGLGLDYDGFTNLHYYGGEASLFFDEYNAFEKDGYLKWLENNNVNPYDKTLGHGKIPLGVVADIADAKQKIANNRHIKQILIKE